jgi:peptide/nickel transport system permease protein
MNNIQWINSLKRNKLTIVGIILAIIIVFVAIFAPFLTSFDPVKQNIRQRLKAPDDINILGTDVYGRDILSRILYGTRNSLLIAILSVLFAAFFGITLGLIAGYYGGKIDIFVNSIINILMCFPSIVLSILIVAVLGTGFWKIIIALGVTLLPRFARLARAPVMAFREQEYVLAAKALGQSNFRIMFYHILPNILGEMIVVATLWMSTAVLGEAGLSFLGLGITPPSPSWGSMINEGMSFIINAPWHSIFPGIAIFLMVIAFNLIGDGLRDILDPKLRGA